MPKLVETERPTVLPRIDIRRLFPNLGTVAKELYPGANHDHPTIENYERALELKGELTPAVKEAIEKARAAQANYRTIVYIAGPLTGVDEPTKARYGQISELLAEYGDLFFGYVPHLHGTDPVKHPNVTPTEVRNIDFLWARVVAGWHVNCLNPTAHGPAIEFGWSEEACIPTDTVNQEGNKLSRLTRGMNNVDFQVLYQDFSEALNKLKPRFDEFANWLKTFPGRDPRGFYYRSPERLRDVALRLFRIDPSGWHLTFTTDQFMIYVAETGHQRYGQAGNLEFHDRRGRGVLGVRFSDGILEELPDHLSEAYGEKGFDLHWWLK